MVLSGVLLDIDGTLVSSNDAHAHAWVEAFADYGYDLPYERVRPMIGMGSDHIVPMLFPDLSKEEDPGKSIVSHRRDIMLQKYAPNLSPTQGSRELVQKLQNAGLKVIVATSASDRELENLLKAAQVNDLLDEFTTADEVGKSKPEPDIVKAALSKIQLPADQTVMLADTPYDIEAAGKVGVGVIAFRSGGFSDEDLAGAIAIYDDPADLLEHYDESLLGQRR